MHSNTTASQGPAGMAAVADNVHINPDSVLHRTFRSGGRKIKKNRPRLGMAQRETSRDRLAITPGVKFSTFNESDGHDLVGGSAWAAACLDLVYFHGKSVKEVAEIVGIATATVKTRMFYARKKLADFVASA
jgi:hypothetical protein